MKLGKLLAAGKSIMGGQAAVSYRSSKQIYLPKFGSPKNPFKPGDSASATESTPSPASPAPVAAQDSRTGGPTRLAPSDEPVRRQQEDRPPPEPGKADLPLGRTHGGTESAPLPGSGVLSAAQTVRRLQTVTAGAQTANTARFNAIQRINALFSIFRTVLLHKAKRPENAARGHNGMPTQTELSLDAVKVVHNDLSDVDVEVVPIKSRASATDLPAPRKSWEFVGERLFGVEAT
ncbi:MAG TPA: hypothetical protein VGY56_04415 [Verrucomicrobiae bacterium]|nr:hypothetical protein [Verrucomicrobiae bacterium]